MAAGFVVGSAVYQLLVDDQISKGLQGAEREVSASAGRIASGLATAEQSTKTLGSSLAGVSGQSKTAGTALEGTASQGRTLGTSLTGVAGESKSAGSALEGAAAQGRTLGSAMGTAAESSRGLGSVLGSVAGQAAGFATGMLAMRGISTVFDALKGATIGYNATMEQTTVAFTGLLGSGEKAAGFMKDLRDFAATTPFEFPQLTSAAQKLIGVGMAAQDVVPAMRAIGDAVAGMGGNATDIDRVTLALTQMMSNGKVQAQDMLQITSANIPAWRILAESMGKSVSEVQAMSQSGELLAKDTVPLLIAGMEHAFGGQMAEQAKTFTGLFSTLKDSINMALGGAMKPVFDQVKVELQGLVTYTNGPAFQKFADNLSVGATELAKQVGAYLSKQGPALERDLQRVGDFARDDVPQLGHAFLEVADVVGKIAAAVKDIGERLSGVTGAVKELDSAVLNGKGIEILVALYGLNKVGALSAGGSLLGKIPNPFGGSAGGAGEGGMPGALGTLNVEAQVVNVNGPTSGGGGVPTAGQAGEAAGGAGTVATGLDIGATAATALAEGGGVVLAGGVIIGGAALWQHVDPGQGGTSVYGGFNYNDPTSYQQYMYQFQLSQRAGMQGPAIPYGFNQPPATDAQSQVQAQSMTGVQDAVSTEQLAAQSSALQEQANSYTAVKDAILQYNAEQRANAEASGQAAQSMADADQAARSYARAQADAASGMTRLRDINDGAANTLQTTSQAQKDQITALGSAIDANTQKMARLKDINEGASNTIQRTTPFVLAQVGAWNAAQTAQEHLTETYQAGLQAMSDYNRQAGEYKGEADAIAAAVQIVQDKQKAGIPLTQEEKTLLGEQAELTKRLVGGQKDATEQAGFAAAANAELMKAQDHLNDLLRDGINSGSDLSDAYKGVEEATAKAAKFGLDPAAQSGSAMNESLSKLQGVVDKDLVPSLDALIKTLGGIPPTHDTKITADNKQAIQSADDVNAKNIADKNLMIGGDNKKALGAIDDVNSATVQNKGISIGGDNSGALGSVAGTNDAHVDNKTLDIYGNNVDALNKLGQVEQFVIHDKTFTITSQTQNIGEGVTAQAGGSPPGGEPRNLIALVNEIGPELIRFPYAGAFAMGGTVGFANGGLPGLTFLPRGAEVIPASRTAQLLDRLSQAQAMWQGGGATGGGGGITINLPAGAVQVQAGASAEEVARVAGAQVYELVLSGLNSSAAQYAGPNAPGTV